MYRIYTLVLIAIVAIAGIPGCSSVHRVTADEIRLNQDKKYSEVVFPSKITGLVLPPEDADDSLLKKMATAPFSSKITIGNQIKFDDNCGILNNENYTLAGITSKRDTVEVKLENVFFVEFKNTDFPRAFMTPDSVLKICEATKFEPDKAIQRAKVPYWDVVSFDKIGGKYDPLSDKLYGHSKGGSEVSVNLSEIHYAKYKKYLKVNVYKNIRIGLFLVGIAAFSQGVYDIFDL